MGGKGSKEAEMHSRKPDISDKADKSGVGDAVAKISTAGLVGDAVAKTSTAGLVGGGVVKGLFSYIGFSSAGPVAGSAAAGSAAAGSAAAGSAFATAQSIGMSTVLGIFSAPLAIGVTAGVGTYATVKLIRSLSKSNDQQNGDGEVGPK